MSTSGLHTYICACAHALPFMYVLTYGNIHTLNAYSSATQGKQIHLNGYSMS